MEAAATNWDAEPGFVPLPHRGSSKPTPGDIRDPPSPPRSGDEIERDYEAQIELLEAMVQRSKEAAEVQ